MASLIVKNSNILVLDGAMDEDEMLKKAIAMSLEEKTGVRFAKRGNKAESWTLQFSGVAQEQKLAQNDDEEEMLKVAIAMSLQDQ